MTDLIEKAEAGLQGNPYALYNHLKIADVKPDYAEVYVDIVPEFLNGHGTLHGGVYYTLADYCVGVVSRTNGKMYVTQQASVSYISSVKGGRLTAKGSVIHRGRTSCIIEILVTDESGKLVFKGTFTDFCIGDEAIG